MADGEKDVMAMAMRAAECVRTIRRVHAHELGSGTRKYGYKWDTPLIIMCIMQPYVCNVCLSGTRPTRREIVPRDFDGGVFDVHSCVERLASSLVDDDDDDDFQRPKCAKMLITLLISGRVRNVTCVHYPATHDMQT